MVAIRLLNIIQLYYPLDLVEGSGRFLLTTNKGKDWWVKLDEGKGFL